LSRLVSLWALWSLVQALPYPPHLEKESDVWINSLLLEQKVVGLLEVLEGEVVL